MTQRFIVHPENPQARLLRQAADIIHGGGVIIYPTDSCYALACHLGDKKALERICRIRQINDKHLFTLMCKDLAEISDYAKVENSIYRMLKVLTPGCFTFVLKAKNKVPRRLMHSTRKTIGFRIPDNQIAIDLLQQVGEPLMTTSLILPDNELPHNDPDDIYDDFSKHVDLFIDGGSCGYEVTTVIDCTDNEPSLIRQGKGDFDNYV